MCRFCGDIATICVHDDDPILLCSVVFFLCVCDDMATVYDNVVSFCVVLSPFCVGGASICIIDVAAM